MEAELASVGQVLCGSGAGDWLFGLCLVLLSDLRFQADQAEEVEG